MMLPKDFSHRMKHLLGNEADAFFDSYLAPRTYGLRCNLLKYPGGFPDSFPFHLTPISWIPEGYYYQEEEHPGKHPLHEAGAYYIQEPSAMSVVQLLSPAKGDVICDLCAAPGGKSTQIAAKLNGTGLLVSNEISAKRTKSLSENLERFGVTNAVTTNEPPEKMSACFPCFFDKILVDAPCSGEGMFRKDASAIAEWSRQQVEVCAKRQKMILNHADIMLKPGGVLVYSTCTFSTEENEEVIHWFLKEHPMYTLEKWNPFFPENTGIHSGFDMPEAMRLFPHKLKGEGHFAARLRKAEDTSKKQSRSAKRKRRTTSLSEFSEFQKVFISQKSPVLSTCLGTSKNYHLFGNELYLVPDGMISLDGIKVMSAGLHLGTIKKGRFEPAHALAKAAMPDDMNLVKHCTDSEASLYLHGDTLPCPLSCKGWVLVCYEGISLGWAKAGNGNLKNHYPKGLRTPFLRNCR